MRGYEIINRVKLPYMGLVGWIYKNSSGVYFFATKQNHIVCEATTKEDLVRILKHDNYIIE